MKIIEKGLDILDRIRNIDYREFLSDARKKMEEISENPGRFALETLLQLKLAYQMLESYIHKEYKLPWKTALALIVLFLYFINPFDIIPDFIPGFGYIDDAMAIGVALKFIRGDLKEYALHKNLNPLDYGLG